MGGFRPGFPVSKDSEIEQPEDEGEEEVEDEDGDYTTDDEPDDEKAGRGVYKLKPDGPEEPDPTDSDREYQVEDKVDDKDVTVDESSFVDAPYKVVDDPDDTLRPMLLYDVRVTLPKTVVSTILTMEIEQR